MENLKKWSVKDVITLVLMTVLLIVIQLGINMVCMINDFASMVLSVGITMLLCGPVYFLMVNRVRKRFVSLVYMTPVSYTHLDVYKRQGLFRLRRRPSKTLSQR